MLFVQANQSSAWWCNVSGPCVCHKVAPSRSKVPNANPSINAPIYRSIHMVTRHGRVHESSRWRVLCKRLNTSYTCYQLSSSNHYTSKSAINVPYDPFKWAKTISNLGAPHIRDPHMIFKTHSKVSQHSKGSKGQHSSLLRVPSHWPSVWYNISTPKHHISQTFIVRVLFRLKQSLEMLLNQSCAICFFKSYHKTSFVTPQRHNPLQQSVFKQTSTICLYNHVGSKGSKLCDFSLRRCVYITQNNLLLL